MKLILLVEGVTERLALEAFLKRWLDPRLFKSLVPESVAAKCPYFKALLEGLLELARSAGR